MTPKTVQRAQDLLRERRQIAEAKWNALGEIDNTVFHPKHVERADEELQAAIEEFRKRKLQGIDAMLRELGVEPDAAEDA